jgi:hypothetical protein
MMKKILAILVSIFVMGLVSCATAPSVPQKAVEPSGDENQKFLKSAPESPDEVFRVLILSDHYEAVKSANIETIARSADIAGDKFICDELTKFDKINESREAVLSVSLYPDTGRIMKVRPKKLAALREIDELVVEDIQRWNIVSPLKKQVAPLKFDVRYRVVLRKKQSDEEIIKEVREKMKEKANQ